MTREHSRTEDRQQPWTHSKNNHINVRTINYPIMRKISLLLAALAAIASACTNELRNGETIIQNNLPAKLAGEQDGENEPGTILVRLSGEASEALQKGSLTAEDIFGKDLQVTMAPTLEGTPKNLKVARELGLDLWYTVRFETEISPEIIAEKASGSEHISVVQFNSLIDPTVNGPMEQSAPASVTKAPAADMPFNDPMLPQQWHLINDGTVAKAVEGADVGVKDAWRLCTGDSRIIVAVLDEGVMTAHPDLKDVMWTNAAEDAGTVGVDDDNNGYTDDVNGYNFAENKGRVSATGSSATGHGTHVAGSIAARNGNGVGVSSIAGGSGSEIYDGVRIMSCQIFRKGAKASDEMTGKAFIYAADHGACIAQCSYGSLGGAIMSDQEYVEGISGKTMAATFEYAALQYFMHPDNSNCDAVETNIAIFAAGNNNGPASSYPGALPFCISVTAFGPDFLPGGYSNHGPGCDISAPGGDPCLINGTIGQDLSTCILSTGVSGSSYSTAGYVYNYGTSMACPQVSGVVALGMSYALKLGKRFSREDFISRLLTSTNDIDKLMTGGSKPFYNLNTNAYDSFLLTDYKGKMGAGAVDAWQFLMALEGTPVVIAKTGEDTSIDLAQYLGATSGNFSYTMSMDDKSKASLGLTSDPVVSSGKMTFRCTKTGAGKVKFTASVGKDTNREDGIAGLEFTREISIVSRTFAASNGGWL